MSEREEQNLYEYVRRKLRSGHPEGELRNELIKEGHSPEEIESLFYRISNRNRLTHSSKHEDFPVWYLISFGLLITGIAILGVYKNSDLGYFFVIPGVAGILIRWAILIGKKIS